MHCYFETNISTMIDYIHRPMQDGDTNQRFVLGMLIQKLTFLNDIDAVLSKWHKDKDSDQIYDHKNIFVL